MKIAFVMDPMQTIRHHKDTSWILMVAAAELGYEVYHCLPEDLSLSRSEVLAKLQKVEVQSSEEFQLKDIGRTSLAKMNAVIIRKDPPFDRRYFYMTLLLDFLPPTTRVVNRPQSLRDWNEKLSALLFSEFCPPTLISQDKDEIIQFARQYDFAILKPIDGFGGRGIFKVKSSDDKCLQQKVDEVSNSGSHKIVVNPFLPEADAGDKRVLFVDGQPIGAILRKAQTPGALNNLDQGGQALPYQLTEAEKQICIRLGPEFVKRGLFFVGIDLLGTYLTEINVTSPTGLQELVRFSGIPHHIHTIEKLFSK